MSSFFICQECGTKNKTDATVCTSCNLPLGISCPNCAKLNAALLHYCEFCGASLLKNSADEGLPVEAERLHLNIMFCDLVGSTALSETLDPEVFRDIVVEYQDVCAKVIEEQGGYIAQYLGDGILVYFGYPKTYEDNSQRAVQSALNIVEQVKILSDKFVKEEKPAIDIRIGIHTGLVVMGEIGGGTKRERLALGETPNIASRIQTLAEPNEILISADTYKIVQKSIYCREKGTHTLKGISVPVTVYQPISIELTKSFTKEQKHYDYPPVGREAPIKQLGTYWNKVLQGRGHTVIIRGEIGTGKSHVINYFTASISDKEAKKIFFKCTSYSQNNSLFPFVNILNMLIDIDKDESDEAKLSKVEKFLESLKFNLPEMVPVVCSLLSIPLSSGYQSLSSSTRLIMEKTYRFFKNLFITLSESFPLILIIEDLQFADKLSLELFNRLVHPSNHRIFYLLSCRKEFNIPLNESAGYHLIDLLPLDKENSEKLAVQIAGNKKLPEEITRLILEKTQGIQLFIEELMYVILDSDILEAHEDHYTLKGPLPDTLIPATLQDLLFAKLDQLGKAKEVAQLAAVFGRDFTADMLQVISGLEFETLSEHLNTLVNESVLVVKGKLPHIHFSFKQALMQEKAYQLLLISKRQQDHLMIAEALVRNYSAYAKANPDFIAHHYTLGEKIIPAIEYWHKAGVLSLSRSAYDESIVFFQKGLELIPRIENEKQKNSLELLLLSGLAPALLTTKGYTDESVGPAFERAYELVSRVRNLPHLSSILSGLWAHYTALGKHQTAFAVAKRLSGIAQRTKDDFVKFEAAKATGANLFWRGEFLQAHRYLSKALKNFNPETPYAHDYLYAEHPVVSTLTYYALNSWVMGNAQEALKSLESALSYAKKLNHPFTLIYATGFATILHQLRGDVAQTKIYGKETLQLGERYGFTFWMEMGNIFYRWASAVKDSQRGLKGMEEAVRRLRDSGTSLWVSNALGMLAELYGKTKQLKKAHALVDEALHLATRNNEKFFSAELLRIKGTLLLKSRKKAMAEKFFKRALKTAEKQQAKYFELRAALSLASLKSGDGQLVSSLLSEFPDNEKSRDILNAEALYKKISTS